MNVIIYRPDEDILLKHGLLYVVQAFVTRTKTKLRSRCQMHLPFYKIYMLYIFGINIATSPFLSLYSRSTLFFNIPKLTVVDDWIPGKRTRDWGRCDTARYNNSIRAGTWFAAVLMVVDRGTANCAKYLAEAQRTISASW